ncbi:hypothetical protein BGZ96_008133 [Linnemannia gamsii]|uniref:F-box domain-containing protein n=1 Tax=Linnemannia gamsii TaxID=64522 RepID=A0ABQ7KD98_9FUNG|nr:hypothetical protein BGZ96_008133 [Linnemannia gamsii]
MGTDTTTDASKGQPQPQLAKRLSPFEIPELLNHIASYLSANLEDLGRAAQVSTSFHAACTPLFWRYIILDGEDASEIWESHKGFRMGMIRYGRFVEELQLMTRVQDADLELIAENFTRLKKLNLSGTNLSEETLKVLIHSDPYRVTDEGVGGANDTKKRKAVMGGTLAKRKVGAKASTTAVIDDEEEEDGLDGIVRDDAVDAEIKMAKYREYTETETEHEFDSQYESVGILNPSSTATESEQDRPTGSIPRGSAASTPTTKGVRKLAGRIPLHRQSGTTRPAKFKGTKTQFPFFLEELVLNRCGNLTGTSVLKVVGRLGPQLKRLHLNHVAELSDRDVLGFVKHVPQLVEINIKGTDVTDTLLQGLAELTAGTSTTEGSTSGTEAGGRAGLESVNLNMLNVSPAGLIPLIKANKSTFKSIAFEHNHSANNEVLYSFIEVSDSNNTKTSAITQNKQTIKKGGASARPVRAFDVNTVLTSLRVSYCTTLSDEGLAILFTSAIELQTVEIDGTSVGDESLLALAATYRNRMKRLGYGVPAAWREFEIAEDGVLITEHAKKPSETGAAALLRQSQGADSSLKVYSGHTVAGGLRRLSMKHCPRITNKGLRAIVRSCVNLEGLNVSNCGRVSVEIFNGPWACTQFINLMITGMPLELMPSTTGYATLVKEEVRERQRFPLQEEEFPVKYEFDYQGNYDYIVLPMREEARSGRGGTFGFSFGDDDEEQEEEDDEELLDDAAIMAAIKAAVAAAAAKHSAKNKAKNKTETIRYKFPADGKTKTLSLPPLKNRNTNAQRALLKQFYSKLGLLKNLYYFDMSQCCFRVSPKDGLELVLPGLQKSLETWNLYRPPGYNLHDSDLEFFGRYFGHGRKNCPITIGKLDVVEQEQRVAADKAKKKADKGKKTKTAKATKGKKAVQAEEEEDEDEDEDEEDELPRVAKLDELIVSKYATEDDLDYEVFEWFMDQGIDLVQLDDFDYDMM